MRILIGLIIFFICVNPNAASHHYQSKVKTLPDKELLCLAKNAYYEARGEGELGLLLVTQVVYNRVTGNNFCDVIYRHKQFSWTLRKQKPISKEELMKLKWMMLAFHNDYYKIPDHLKEATHFHAVYIKPYWSRNLKYLGQWKNHRFYKEI